MMKPKTQLERDQAKRITELEAQAGTAAEGEIFVCHSYTTGELKKLKKGDLITLLEGGKLG